MYSTAHQREKKQHTAKQKFHSSERILLLGNNWNETKVNVIQVEINVAFMSARKKQESKVW